MSLANVLQEIAVDVVLADDLDEGEQIGALWSVVSRHTAIAKAALASQTGVRLNDYGEPIQECWCDGVTEPHVHHRGHCPTPPAVRRVSDATRERDYAVWARDHGAIREDMANAWLARIDNEHKLQWQLNDYRAVIHEFRTRFPQEWAICIHAADEAQRPTA